MPEITARALGRHQGAPIPASPGRTRAPAELSASRASSLSAGGSSAMPSWLHIHSSIAPAAKTPPSRAYSTCPSIPQGTGGQQPTRRLRHLLADVGEHEDAGAVGRLHATGLDARGPGQRRLLIH